MVIGVGVLATPLVASDDTQRRPSSVRHSSRLPAYNLDFPAGEIGHGSDQNAVGKAVCLVCHPGAAAGAGDGDPIAGMSANMSSSTMPSPRCPCCATSTPGDRPRPRRRKRSPYVVDLVLVIALALLFALTSNDIISYITK